MAILRRKPPVIVCGILFRYPLAGVTYQFLHYLIALRRLGFDPYYIEDSGRAVYDPRTGGRTGDASGNVAAVAPTLEAYAFGDRWAFRDAVTGRCYGKPHEDILQLYRDAVALLNVTGAQEIRDEHLACRRRIYVESDPFPAQVGVADDDSGTLQRLSAHDMHFSFGENLGAADCLVPVNGRFQWLPTRQPVVLDMWSTASAPARDSYTTVTTWSNPGKEVSYRGEVYYWTKNLEFERFLDVPQHCGVKFEMAANVNLDVQHRLQALGWSHLHPESVSVDVSSYRDYIQGSRGEFTVARDQYVRPRTGWFSDRSACYLAAGRPVITQETGFSKFLPTGRGLFAFTSMDEIVAAVEAIESDYAGHCAAAREIAREYFSAERVVESLMRRAELM